MHSHKQIRLLKLLLLLLPIVLLAVIGYDFFANRVSAAGGQPPGTNSINVQCPSGGNFVIEQVNERRINIECSGGEDWQTGGDPAAPNVWVFDVACVGAAGQPDIRTDEQFIRCPDGSTLTLKVDGQEVIGSGKGAQGGDGGKSGDTSPTNPDGTCPDGFTHVGVPLEGSDPCLKNQGGDDNIIYVYMRTIVRFLAAGTGLVIVLMIIIGGIQYIVSQGDPQRTVAAKGRIFNAIIALFLFIFMSAILNFLIPGGIL